MFNVNKDEVTPMMKQYLAVREELGDAILFYQLGDFYEMFFDDAITASKVLNLIQDETIEKNKLNSLPFSEEEAKFITGFIMHQKLSDLIYTIETQDKDKVLASEIYSKIRGMNYEEYAKKYLIQNQNENIETLSEATNLFLLSDFLKNNDNYIIYHSLDDYLVNQKQLAELKKCCNNKIILFNNGSHLGFLYRKEFLNSLKNQIPQKDIDLTLNDEYLLTEEILGEL